MSSRLRVLVWGTADLGKPRTRIMLAALEAAGVDVHIIREPVWDGIDDKSRLLGPLSMLLAGGRYVSALVRLRRRMRRAPPHDVVLIGYLGLFDVLGYRRFAGRQGKPLVWDAFLSLHDTVIQDRLLLSPKNPAARALWRLEAAAARAADRIVLDTGAHAARFAELFQLPADKLAAVPVGAEPAFPPLPPKPRDGPFTILFYGQFIPLHGIDTIVDAARLARGRGWRWRIIGTGQEGPRIRSALAADPVEGIDRADWVPYEALSAEIAVADVCLGIFGDSAKAAAVVPNKVYQIIASGRPLVTRESSAMGELAPAPVTGIVTVSPGDAEAIVAALDRLEATLPADGFHPGPDYEAVRERFALPVLGTAWFRLLKEAVSRELTDSGSLQRAIIPATGGK